MPNNNDLLEKLLETTIREQASDLHLSPGHPPLIRVAGKLIPLLKYKKIEEADFLGLMTQEQLKRLQQEREIDFSYNFGQTARFRVNVFF